MNRVSTLFPSIHLLKMYSVKITVFSGVFCKMEFEVKILYIFKKIKKIKKIKTFQN